MNKIKYFRYNEAGDFHSQNCVEKLSEISKFMKEKFKIKTYGYTARSDLNFYNVYFKVKNSNSGTNGNNGRVIIIPTVEDLPKGYYLCPSNCGECFVCLTKRNVAFVEHGRNKNYDKYYKNVHIPKSNPKYIKHNGLEVSIGNTKLDNIFMIFNMGDAMSCPSARLGLCTNPNICYARQSEKQYNAVLQYRKRQKEYWLGNYPERIIDDFNYILRKTNGVKQ